MKIVAYYFFVQTFVCTILAYNLSNQADRDKFYDDREFFQKYPIANNQHNELFFNLIKNSRFGATTLEIVELQAAECDYFKNHEMYSVLYTSKNCLHGWNLTRESLDSMVQSHDIYWCVDNDIRKNCHHHTDTNQRWDRTVNVCRFNFRGSKTLARTNRVNSTHFDILFDLHYFDKDSCVFLESGQCKHWPIMSHEFAHASSINHPDNMLVPYNKDKYEKGIDASIMFQNPRYPDSEFDVFWLDAEFKRRCFRNTDTYFLKASRDQEVKNKKLVNILELKNNELKKSSAGNVIISILLFVFWSLPLFIALTYLIKAKMNFEKRYLLSK